MCIRYYYLGSSERSYQRGYGGGVCAGKAPSGPAGLLFRHLFSCLYGGGIGLDQWWACYFAWILMQEKLSFETNKIEVLLVMYFFQKIQYLCKISFILSLWIKSFLFELNFRKCNKALSWWNVETKLKFLFEIGILCLLSSLLNNLIENVVYHIRTLNIVFFKTRFSHCKWKKKISDVFNLKNIVLWAFYVGVDDFQQPLSPLGSVHRCSLCFI